MNCKIYGNLIKVAQLIRDPINCLNSYASLKPIRKIPKFAKPFFHPFLIGSLSTSETISRAGRLLYFSAPALACSPSLFPGHAGLVESETYRVSRQVGRLCCPRPRPIEPRTPARPPGPRSSVSTEIRRKSVADKKGRGKEPERAQLRARMHRRSRKFAN